MGSEGEEVVDLGLCPHFLSKHDTIRYDNVLSASLGPPVVKATDNSVEQIEALHEGRRAKVWVATERR